MAFSADSYFNNAIVGVPQVAGNVNIYDSATEPKFALGTVFKRSDGSEFRYAHFGATTGAGMLVSQDLSESSVVDTDNVVIAPASAVAVDGETIQPGAIGSHYVEITLASVSADQYAGGYLHTTDDTGEGYVYRIKGNTATNNPATGNIRVQLYEPIQVALDATTDIAITGSLYANLEPATTTDIAASGVALAAQAANDYGWVQTAGVATVLTDGVIVIGSGVVIGSVAGSVAVEAAAAIVERVGVCLIVGDDTGYSSIKLTLN